MVIEIREVCQQDKAQWLQLWEGYTRFYGSRSRPTSRNLPGSGCLIPLLLCWAGLPWRMATSLDLRFVSFTKAPG
ncbi:Histone acetyltransferase HPA2 related acetyltransferase [Klebsiella michiganensis]|nr:Histone acetyltransferase HPA2 related acetyltransferase [Klebsiella michiganensis]